MRKINLFGKDVLVMNEKDVEELKWILEIVEFDIQDLRKDARDKMTDGQIHAVNTAMLAIRRFYGVLSN